jgi:hypothetical protein
MNGPRRNFSLIGMALLGAAALFWQQVKTDYDRAADFSQYKMYSGQEVQTQDRLCVDRIEQAVNADLSAKGWTQVSSGGKVTEWLSGDFGEAERILRRE